MKKKKLFTAALSFVLAVGLLVGVTACGGSKDNEPYYNNTYTISGTCTIDWDGKDYRDNYGQDSSKYFSQREIIEKYWDVIDWDKTFAMNNMDMDSLPAHGSVDEFIQSFKEFEEYAYESLAGLKISVSGKDNPTLTVTFTSEMMEYPQLSNHYDAEITMPLCETNEQFAANQPFAGYNQHSFDTPGYCGIGVYKTEDNHVLTVDFNVEKYVKGIHLRLCDYELNTDGECVNTEILLEDEFSVMTLYDAQGKNIWDVRFYIDFKVTDNK